MTTSNNGSQDQGIFRLLTHCVVQINFIARLARLVLCTFIANKFTNMYAITNVCVKVILGVYNN